MSNIKTLNAKREKLVAQLKLIDTAIKKEKEREQQQKSKAIFDALAARGLLDKDLDSILAAITSTAPKTQEPATSEEDELRNL